MHLTCFKYADTFLHERYIFCREAEDRFRPIPLTLFLIEADDGRRILADTGCDWLPGFVMRRFQRPAELLQNAGIRLDSISDVFLTHSHLDHAGCSYLFPNAVFHMHEEEVTDARAFLPDHANIQTFRETVEIAPNVHGIWIGGHTKGSSIMRLDTEEAPWILAGDECYSPDCIRRGIPTGSSACPERSARFIQEYGSPEYRTLIFHDLACCPDELGAYPIF